MELVRDEDYTIDSITIIRNGYLVTDAYLYPFQKNTPHIIHSCTKSITSALVGIAIDKGYIKSVKQPVHEFFPEKTIANLDDQKRAITLEDLLTMSSGLETKDSFLYEWKGLGEMKNSEDWVQYVLDLPMEQSPGERFKYSNGVSYLLTAIIQKVTKMRVMDFAKKHLFEPLSITDVKWPTDPKGVNIGWGEMFLTPHDMAKFGLLYLNKGSWDGRQIVSESWVDASTRKQVPSNVFEPHPPFRYPYDGYGYQWWRGSSMYYADMFWRMRWNFGWKHDDSDNYFLALGYLGQYIFVVPEKNMVVVFTSHLENAEMFIPKGLLDEFIIPAAVSNQLLASQSKKKKLDSLSANFAEAPVQGVIWTSEEKGVAKNGEFIHTASPAFRFKYPKTSFKQKIDYPGAVMVMKTFGEIRFSASIDEIPAGIKLSDVGPKNIASNLKKIGSDIQVLSNKSIGLEDGTEAYSTDISWKFESSWSSRSLFVSAFKEGKMVVVEYHFPFAPWDEASTSDYLKEGAFIVESLTFK